MITGCLGCKDEVKINIAYQTIVRYTLCLEGEMAKVPPQHDSFESPESSTIVSAHYDGQTMIVYFQRAANRDHQRYDYTNFPSELWERFKQAESKGAFFSAHIRPFYAGRRFV